MMGRHPRYRPVKQVMPSTVLRATELPGRNRKCAAARSWSVAGCAGWRNLLVHHPWWAGKRNALLGAALPTEERWQLVTCIKSMSAAGATAAGPAATVAADRVISNAPPPEPPFTDYRFEKPGTIRHISLADLPQPYATKSAIGGPTIVGRPENAWPKAPEGFTVGLYATGLTNPRILVERRTVICSWPKPPRAILKSSAG